jgi:hypothetical protein
MKSLVPYFGTSAHGIGAEYMLVQGLLGSYFLFLISTSEKKIIPTA